MSRRGNLALLVAAFLLAVLAGCASRIAPHDDTIAAGLAKLQASHARFFDQLQQTAGTPGAAWEAHAAWYKETRAEIATLRARAASYGLKHDPTPRAIALLEQSVDELEQAHAEGLSPGEIPVLRTLFDSQLRMLIQLEAAKKPKRNALTEVSS
jgi:hypothetical protein